MYSINTTNKHNLKNPSISIDIILKDEMISIVNQINQKTHRSSSLSKLERCKRSRTLGEDNVKLNLIDKNKML